MQMEKNVCMKLLFDLESRFVLFRSFFPLFTGLLYTLYARNYSSLWRCFVPFSACFPLLPLHSYLYFDSVIDPNSDSEINLLF